MSEVATEEQIYYIYAMGEDSTYIGSRMVQPNVPALKFTEAEYKRHKKAIDLYKDSGVIAVAEPGSSDAYRKADAIEREDERLAGIFATGMGEDPDPVLRLRGHSVPEDYARKRMSSNTPPQMPKFAGPSEETISTETGDKCIAIARSEKRCKNGALADLLVCGVHNRMLQKGDLLKDSRGRAISTDGTRLES